jgi:hypothetical protein
MTTVDEWARREAERRYPPEHYYGNLDQCDAAQEAGAWGINRLAALLLSDKVARAMSDSVLAETGELFRDYVMRTAMQAVLTKITEGEE